MTSPVNRDQREVVTDPWSPLTSRTPAGHHNCACHPTSPEPSHRYGAPTSASGSTVCFGCGRRAPTLPVEHPDDEGWFYDLCRHCIP